MGKQVDLFLDTIVSAPLKDDRALMEFPFFSLQKHSRTEPIVYEDGAIKIRISAGEKGIATIWDKDILIYVASAINDRIERGLPVSRTVQFHAHDLLKLTGRGTGKRAYELLLDALYRLRSTTIETTIESAELRERRGFGWIETWKVVERTTTTGKKVMAAIEVTLNDWMFRAIVQDRRVLTINPAYFELEKGLERRLYELARKHVGEQPEWRVGLEKLARKVGTSRTLRFFKRDLLEVIERNALPDYTVELETELNGSRPIVVFRPRTL
ncbi:replication initiator protein A [Azospirillum sp.]|uniref:replication initiator protein A n=1 Tax=Azospirillum sp. TaxID=34012 RepID=UPI003D716289